MLSSACAIANCGECGRMRCARCGRAAYCGAAHQREHWAQHRKECQLPARKVRIGSERWLERAEKKKCEIVRGNGGEGDGVDLVGGEVGGNKLIGDGELIGDEKGIGDDERIGDDKTVGDDEEIGDGNKLIGDGNKLIGDGNKLIGDGKLIGDEKGIEDEDKKSGDELVREEVEAARQKLEEWTEAPSTALAQGRDRWDWRAQGLREYLPRRLELFWALVRMGWAPGGERALIEAVETGKDILWLSRDDPFDMYACVPLVLAKRGRWREAYAMMRWGITHGKSFATDPVGTKKRGFLLYCEDTVNLFEPLEGWLREGNGNVTQRTALALLKLQLAASIETSTTESISDATRLREQALVILRQVHNIDNLVIPAILDPTFAVLLGEDREEASDCFRAAYSLVFFFKATEGAMNLLRNEVVPHLDLDRLYTYTSQQDELFTLSEHPSCLHLEI